ncbi:hypothetical protein ACMS1Z_13605 [Acidiphilium multivorum]|uniref:hypothetical protein n=1 Tax=Acidiphilium multivorum TaxID=62140 RepID=UPI0039C9F114
MADASFTAETAARTGQSEHFSEWVRLTAEKNKGATCADIPRGRGQPQGGINAATRELRIDRTER